MEGSAEGPYPDETAKGGRAGRGGATRERGSLQVTPPTLPWSEFRHALKEDEQGFLGTPLGEVFPRLGQDRDLK